MLNSVTPNELKKRMDSESGTFILDVRKPTAYEEWRIQGRNVQSVNIQNSKLKELGVGSFTEIPKDREIITVCAKGVSAQETATILEEEGYQVAYLEGGMEAWSQYYEPVAVVNNEKLAIYQILRLAKGCLSYLIVSGDEAIVVDAGRHVDRYIEFAKEIGVTIRYVLDTHLHADHISGGVQLAAQTGAKYSIAPEEAIEAGFPYEPLQPDGGLSYGKTQVNIVNLRTPGHTVASTSFLVNGRYLLSGDTLFVSGLGRSDLKGRTEEMAGMMFETVRTILSGLPDELLILPGHYSGFQEINSSGFVGASMGEIRAKNPMLHMVDNDEFVAMAIGNAGVTPPNHEAIIAINQGKRYPSPEEQTELEIGPNRCAVKH